AAIQNILLKLTEAGLGSVFIGHFYDQGIRDILEIPEDIFVEALIPVAKPIPNLKLPSKSLMDMRDILFLEKWKGKTYKKKIVRV
ncbi:MAG: nitroreductase family protein, partial [Candidatus Pacearchaeota archaeon]